ncbi:hypothetical protein DSO57_1036600 [Entomophthora muscae]|uniref:Uncharacterized protein n=1 Tax=Entomophthora muscae TaxID=34485 RepID=A0ACC2SZ90_9FUNG|nr:hypothetical protein DSO57_1036600 [Entomophthora muscae]
MKNKHMDTVKGSNLDSGELAKERMVSLPGAHGAEQQRHQHLSPMRTPSTIAWVKPLFSTHTFAKKEETYWFGLEEKVSHPYFCDYRFPCKLYANFYLDRTFNTNSSIQNSYEKWYSLATPRPPQGLTVDKSGSMHRNLTITASATRDDEPRYVWFNPIMWGIKATYKKHTISAT